MVTLEKVRQCARKAWFLVRYCTVGVPLSPTVDSFRPPPLEHEWRATLGADRWEYRHRGVRLATIYRMTEGEIDDLGHERFGAPRWQEGFRIEWEDETLSIPNTSYCGTFDSVRAVCRIHTRVWFDD